MCANKLNYIYKSLELFRDRMGTSTRELGIFFKKAEYVFTLKGTRRV